MKKTWFKIKRGLLEPRHRLKMGVKIWLFMHMIDRVDWETGIILEWVDQSEADTLQMPLRTLRQQRSQLEDEGYITCVQLKHHQEITIHNWTNPRKYDGEVYNPKSEGDINLQPSEKEVKGHIKGYNKGTPKVLTKMSTPTSNSHKTNQTTQIVISSKKVEAWLKTTKRDLKAEMPKNAYDEYVSGIEIINFTPGELLELGVKTPKQRDWGKSRLAKTFERHLGGIGVDETEVRFSVYKEMV